MQEMNYASTIGNASQTVGARSTYIYIIHIIRDGVHHFQVKFSYTCIYSTFRSSSSDGKRMTLKSVRNMMRLGKRHQSGYSSSTDDDEAKDMLLSSNLQEPNSDVVIDIPTEQTTSHSLISLADQQAPNRRYVTFQINADYEFCT